MCLIFMALDAHPRYRLIVAANRDEFHSRQTAPLGVWPRAEGANEIIAGRDLVGGGTWMGVTRSGRFAALTNYRGASLDSSDPPSRGGLVTGFLRSGETAQAYSESLRAIGGRYNGFSLLTYDGEHAYCYSNCADALDGLGRGVHGLSNYLLNSPWPKVTRGIDALEGYLRDHADPRELTETFFELLTDSYVPDDHELPDTGVGMERERALAPMFVHGDAYGTRSSAVLLIDTEGELTMQERSYDAGARETGRVELAWHTESVPA